jgi:predicted RecA/RadA family phage recombinase
LWRRPAACSAGKQCKLAPCSGSQPATRSGGADVEVALEGVWELPKAAVAIAQGAPVFWDAATGNVAANIGTSNTLIGGATEARGTSDLTIRVRLNGV